MLEKNFLLLIFLFSVVFVPVFGQKNYNSLMYEANRDFRDKNYEASSSKFLEASKLKQNDFASHYNLANTFYKRKMYPEAIAEYERASKLAKSKSDKMATFYNLGNAHIQSNQNDKAAEYYKKALKQDPYNESARKNYQIAMLKQKEQQQQQNKENQQNQQKEGDNKQGQDKDNKDGKNPQQGDKGNQQQGQGNQGKNPNKNNSNPNMPKEMENALLKRAEDKERETARRILNKNTYSEPQSNEKDW